MGDTFLRDLWFHQVDGVQVEQVVTDAESVSVKARSTAGRAACPACGMVSARVHSRYLRHLVDAAVGGRPTVVELRVRRFRCQETHCARATFAEQVDGLTFRYGRRSSGLQTVLQRLAVMLAGRAGSRPAKTLKVAVSRSTLLRLIRALPDPDAPTPRVLGVDEFALRKGRVYGTILVDVESRRPLDLLPDRTVATISAWLAARSGIAFICRDRSSAYAEAGRTGARTPSTSPTAGTSGRTSPKPSRRPLPGTAPSCANPRTKPRSRMRRCP